MKTIRYNVATIRADGLEAKWTKNRNGAPIIMARLPEGSDRAFYAIGRDMWEAMGREGIRPAFERFTLLGSLFSIPA